MGIPWMTPAEMQQRIVRYGELIPCKTAFIDATRQVLIKKRISPSLVEAYQKVPTSMFTLKRHQDSTSVPRVNRQNVVTRCMYIQPPKSFLYLKVDGVFFGADTVMLGKWCQWDTL